ncbi:MAG TPA: sigma-70 family RNA polymerase sigma factor [Anaerolineales bacterium]|nr:sigma-70 family RNA polymerase sigma factor [Anaerolineales bacterium]
MNPFRRNSDSPIASPADFRDLYERNRLPVFRYIYGLTSGPQDHAEDLTAETFLRAWKARHRFVGDTASATGWLIRVAKRLVIDAYRRTSQATRDLPAVPESYGESNPEQDAIADEQKRFLSTLLRGLPEEQREILTLRYLLGWRVTDIAQHMGASENHISVTIHRTLSRLREKWLESDREDLSVIAVQENIS